MNTIKQDAGWLKKTEKDILGCGKFKKHGLRNKENLCVMFEDITSDGTHRWNPALGSTPPSSATTTSFLNVDAIQDLELDATQEESPASTKGIKRMSRFIDENHKKPNTA